MAHEGVAVQGIDAFEERLVELAAEARLEAHAGIRDAAALATRLLALLGGEGAQIVIEARVTAIGPAKLAVAAQQPAALRAGRTRRLIEKQRMHTGQSVARGVLFELLEQARAECVPIEIGAHQQARSGGGREWRGGGELRVVTAPHALVGARPGKVERESTERVRLDERGARRREPPGIVQGEVARFPAGARTHAMRALQSCEELVARTGMALRAQSIPLLRLELVDAAAKFGLVPGHGLR